MKFSKRDTVAADDIKIIVNVNLSPIFKGTDIRLRVDLIVKTFFILLSWEPG